MISIVTIASVALALMLGVAVMAALGEGTGQKPAVIPVRRRRP